jgi:drug/metabolite transporter (DMT)-like permease
MNDLIGCCAVLGLTGMFGNQFLYIVGLKLTNQNIGSIMSLSQPVFASFFSTMLGMEPFAWGKVGGLLLCIGGAVIMLGQYM